LDCRSVQKRRTYEGKLSNFLLQGITSNDTFQLQIYWSNNNQIHIHTPGENLERLAVGSTEEEWAAKGKELFERKRYSQAKHCYERASKPHEAMICHSYFLRDEARKLPLGDSRRARDQHRTAFIEAAESFLSCAENAVGQYRMTYFSRAAECLEIAQDELRAARTYIKAHDYNNAAKLFRKIGRFDDAIHVIKTKEQHMETEVVDSIKEVARLYYFREKELT
jgi:tetratricopeptide (TPR) repeat protein